jgi:hypothetical protein
MKKVYEHSFEDCQRVILDAYFQIVQASIGHQCHNHSTLHYKDFRLFNRIRRHDPHYYYFLLTPHHTLFQPRYRTNQYLLRLKSTHVRFQLTPLPQMILAEKLFAIL